MFETLYRLASKELQLIINVHIIVISKITSFYKKCHSYICKVVFTTSLHPFLYSSRVRLILKAFAVARYLVSNQRLTKISTNVQLLVKGNKSAREIIISAIPFYQRSLREHLFIARESGRLKLYFISLVLIGVGSYEYYHYCNIVPITHRRHFAIISRDFELQYQNDMVSRIRCQFTTGEGSEAICSVLDDDDERVIFVKNIVSRIADACIYYSPECEQYVNHLKVVVIDDDDVNAYVTMGAVLVVSTGLLNHFQVLKKQGKISNLEECVAGVLSHEMAHMLSRHPVESMLRWTSFAYYVYITLVPDLIFMPMLKGMYDKKMSREQEHEADFQALYLLKRSGFDPTSMITTLSFLPEEKNSMKLLSKTKELVDDHPSLATRILYLQNKMVPFERDFASNYEVKKEKTVKPHLSIIDYFLSFANLW